MYGLVPPKFTKILTSLILVVFSLSFTAPMYSQVTGATLSATVTDATGAIISGAQISIKNTATGISKNVTEQSSGFYTVPNFPTAVSASTLTSNRLSTSPHPPLTPP